MDRSVSDPTRDAGDGSQRPLTRREGSPHPEPSPPPPPRPPGAVDERASLWSLSVNPGTDTEVPTASFSKASAVANHTLGVVSVDVDPHGSRMVTTALDSTIRVMDIRDPSAVVQCGVFSCNSMHLWQAVFNPSGASRPLPPSARAAPGPGPPRARAGRADSPTPSPRFSRSAAGDSILAAGGSGCKLDVYTAPAIGEGDVALSASLDVYGAGDACPDNEFALSVACSPDGKRAAVGCSSGAVAVFDLASGTLVKRFAKHSKPVRCLCFSADSRYLFSGSDDMYINKCDAVSGDFVDSFSGHTSWVLSMDASPDGASLVSGAADNKVKLWDLATKACVQTVSEHAGHVWGARFSRDGAYVASGGNDGTVAVFSVA